MKKYYVKPETAFVEIDVAPLLSASTQNPDVDVQMKYDDVQTIDNEEDIW